MAETATEKILRLTGWTDESREAATASRQASMKGKPYSSNGIGDKANPDYVKPDGTGVFMYRGPGQSTRFYDATGAQHGPEQSNVAPAAAYAEQQGWSAPGLPHLDSSGKLNAPTPVGKAAFQAKVDAAFGVKGR